MNIITAGMPELCKSTIEKLHMNEAIYERNFEQIIGMARSGELDKLCIFIDVWNVYGRSFNSMRGQGAAEKIHEINPNIPILIWDGREYISEDPDVVIPPAFQVTGTPRDIKNANELYLDFEHYSDEQIDEITEKFFAEELSFKDIPQHSCIDFIL